MGYEDISKQLQQISNQLRSSRIQLVLLGLKDTKHKHPQVKDLEMKLSTLLMQNPRRNCLIDDCIEELEALVNILPEHHKIVQNSK